jgi:glycerol uptake facilitator protein
MKVTRRKIAMLVAEFLGTALLVSALLAVSKSTIGIPYFVSIAAAVTIVAVSCVLGSVSGAHLNPVVTLGLWSIRRIKLIPALAYILVQFLGAWAAYLLFSYLTGQDLDNTTADFEGKVLVAEAVGAFVLSLGWAAVVYQRMQGILGSVVIGLSLMIGILVAAVGGGGIINPAAALGMHSWVWGTYVLGPVLGAIIGFNLYGLLFAPEKMLAESADKKKK